MGRGRGSVAHVVDAKRTTTDGVPGVDVRVDLGGGHIVTAEHFGDLGDDSLPLPGDVAIIVPGDGTGTWQIVGYGDPATLTKAGAGEKRVYSRSAPGVAAAHVWAKADGTIVIEGLLSGGKIEMDLLGVIDLNGVKIDKSGNLSAPGEVTAMAATPATAVNLSTHQTPSPMGPLGPPLPGT